MNRLTALTILAPLAVIAALAATPSNPADWNDQQKEAFLRQAEVVESKRLSVGVTGSSKLTLSNGETTHAAHLQTIDESKPQFQSLQGTELNFRDCYKFNIAAYKLDRMLGLNMVPVSVDRKVGRETGAVTWWVDDVLMMELKRHKEKLEPPVKEEWNNQMYRVRVFNELIYNTDANLGNVLITHDWDLWIIDFTRAFRMHNKVRHLENLEKIDPDLLARLKNLDEETLIRELSPYLRKAEVKAIIARRDRIVEHFEHKIAQLGEIAALSEVPERQEEALRVR
jgi:hypothetical protein